MTFDVWDVVRVPFPYTDRRVRQQRPALVVAADPERLQGQLWVLMVTSAENRAWPGDVALTDLAVAGLPSPSVVRCAKLATIESRHADHLGMLADADRQAVRIQVGITLSTCLRIGL